MEKLKGKVVKGVGGRYTVFAEEKKYTCFAQKKIKYFYDEVTVGDDVLFLRQGKDFVLTDILPRKNKLSRPAVANVDGVFVVVAPIPRPDFGLIDKITVNCNKQSVPVTVVINKSDIADDFFVKDMSCQYSAETESIIVVSSRTGEGICRLKSAIAGKTVCMAGQSAVGKTSILNALVPELNLPIGELSAKTDRGRHTTRHNQIYALDNGGYLADTAGFSLLDVSDIKSSELGLYFSEIFETSTSCRFDMCTHTAEPNCAVKERALLDDVFNKKYQRYLALFKEIKEKEENRFN